ICFAFLSTRASPHRALPSFPTRRSSDLRSDANGACTTDSLDPRRAPAQIVRLVFAKHDRHGLVLQIDQPLRGQIGPRPVARSKRSEEHTSELQSQSNLVCRLLLEKKKKK